LTEIAKNEKITLGPNALEAIISFSEGDMRRAINTLQSASSLGKKIDEKSVHQIIGKVTYEDIKEILTLALKNEFIEARNKLRTVLIEYGISGQEIIKELHSEIFRIELPEKKRVEIAEAIGEVDFRLAQGADEEVQLGALLAKIASEDMKK
jgi:replication factor C small subunit